MFVRVLFLILLALDIGAACWLYFAPRAPVAPVPVTDPGVAKLVLLSETDRGTPDAATPSMPPKPDIDPKTETCLSIGAFTTQADVRAAMKALTPFVARIQFRETHVTEVRGYWVYLPAPASRERALDLARQLSSKGISDYYVVTAGAQPNAISLGLFREQGNAEKRLNEIRSLGFKPELTQRSDEVPVYWIDTANARDEPLDWRDHIAALSELHAQPIDCF
ncbi:MAG: SPOR domain-containing protein [Proteobacteria bacterium]|nr:SPOR domain-containing protein [Pseudomonadota bacterium]